MDFAFILFIHTPLNVGVESIYYALAIHDPPMDDNKGLPIVLATTHLCGITFLLESLCLSLGT
jgi:hypothetical protein